MSGSLKINWCNFQAVQYSLYCGIEQGFGLIWWSTRGKSMLGSSDINWNTLSRSTIYLVRGHWTGIGVVLMLNKEQINAWQVGIQLYHIFKQYNTACLLYWKGMEAALIINMCQINAWQFINKLKYIISSKYIPCSVILNRDEDCSVDQHGS